MVAVCNQRNEDKLEILRVLVGCVADRPMCWGIQTPAEEVPCTNQIEFQWAPANDAAIFVKVKLSMYFVSSHALLIYT